MIYMDPIKFSWLSGGFVTEELLENLSDLYSHHYGTWSQHAPYNPGKPIRLSAGRLRSWLADPDSAVYYASSGERLVGYAIAIRKNVKGYGVVSWVTQLVVHKAYRKQGIAKRLLFSIWGLSGDYAWGILSANPYAIRALEKATRRRSLPERIHKNIRKIMSVGIESLSYIEADTEYQVDRENARVNTEFFVDHEDVPEKVKRVTTPETPWLLGGLPEGWEWISFTFRDQPPLSLSPDEIETMVKTSDDIAKEAYSRMDLTNQPWARHTTAETEFILRECGLEPGMRVLDFGCGTGRHSNMLSRHGLLVTGVDYVDSSIKTAAKAASSNGAARFVVGDCRNIDLEELYDAAICLYDVVGSYVSLESNQEVLDNLARHLKTGGIAVISVMNYDLTSAEAKYRFSFAEEPNELLSLEPGTIMEKSGDVFDPDHLMLDEKERIVYRCEQFTMGTNLPKELIVRDRRFTMEQIQEMCEQAGLEVLFSRYVSAADWNKPLARTDHHAKEILLKCRKR